MRKFLVAAIIVGAILLAYWICYGQTTPGNNHAYVLPGKVAIEWKFADAYRVWLSINSLAGSEWIQEGYHPGFTYLRSQFKPIVKQLPEGQYEITFSAEISK